MDSVADLRIVVVLLTVAATFLAALTGYHLLRGTEDACERFGADLELAVTEPTKAPDPDDDGPLEYGSCSLVATKTLDVDLPGWDHHSERTIAGRLWVTRPDRERLDLMKATFVEEGGPGVHVEPLPELGPGAFLVTRSEPEAPEATAFGGPEDPAAALFLPATVYWQDDRRGLYSAAATRDGATAEQAQRGTLRLAELIDRRPLTPMT